MFSMLRLPEIRNKILFTIFIVLIFRILSHIPVPGVDVLMVRNLIQNSQFSDILGLFNIFSGGSLQNFSIVSLGLGPYFNALIIVQLLTFVVPSLEELSKEGETGREKINEYIKFLTLPFAVLQAFSFYLLLQSQNVVPQLVTIDLIILLVSMVAGTYLLIWCSDLLTEKGLGNGFSLLVFLGIVSTLPQGLSRFAFLLNSENFFNGLMLLALSVVLIAFVVIVNEGIRHIPLEYGKRSAQTGSKVTSALPLKINQAGVIPVIFAISVIILPSIIATPMSLSGNTILRDIGYFLLNNYQYTSFLYNASLFVLVVFFTFIYTMFQFNPTKISDDIKKRGGFIPGIRPGVGTTNFLKQVIGRITLGGSLFLGLMSIFPYLIFLTLGFDTFAIGGTSLLIIVSVVLETIRKLDSLVVTNKYQNYLD